MLRRPANRFGAPARTRRSSLRTRLQLERLECRELLSFGDLVQVSGLTPFTDTSDLAGQSGTVYISAEVEPRIAVDPTNPLHLVGVWQQDRWSNGGARGLMAGVSIDGGNTWTNNALPGMTLTAGGSFRRASDPWVTIAPNGDVYTVSLPLTDPVSGISDGLMVHKSTDGGFTWSAPINITMNSNSGLFNDKQSMTADPTDSNYVYVVWDRLNNGTIPTQGPGPAMLSRTTDAGLTWSAPTPLYDPADGQTIGNIVTVLPSGVVLDMCIHINYSTNAEDIVVVRSSDHGATWSAPILVSSHTARGVTDPDTGASVRTGDIIPDIAVDRTTGNAYIVWQDRRFSSGAHDDIAFSMSTDGGLTWTAPTKINQTPTNIPTLNQQSFTPSVAVAANGQVAVSYYDFRNNTTATGLPTDAWIVFANPSQQPLTFGNEQRLTTASFNMELAAVARGYFVGDYEGLTAGGLNFDTFGAFFGATVSTTDRSSIFFRGVIPPSISAASITDVSQAEGDTGTTSFTFTVNLSATCAQTVTVNYATADGTATLAGGDYQTAAGTLTFAPGETSKTITVFVNGDLLDEIDETFFVNLSSPINATLSDPQAIGTINDNDEPPVISIHKVTLAEGDFGSTSFQFTVTLNAQSGRTVTVNFSTENGTATNNDYQSGSGSLTFTPGDTTEQVTIFVNGDTYNENDEVFFVNLADPINASLGVSRDSGTILNDDLVPQVSINNVSLPEGNLGSTSFTFAVNLSAASGLTVTVDYASADGSATLVDGDYQSSAGTLTFSPGETSKNVTVLVNGDIPEEADETFFVNLTNPGNATLGTSQGVGTIIDDDATPSISINNVTLAEGNSGTTIFTFNVTLSSPSGQTVTVNYASADGTATTANGDYQGGSGTLTFIPGDTSENITILVNGDIYNEDDELFLVNLSDPSNATLGAAQGTGTIANDDPLPLLSINDVALAEGNGTGTTSFTFTVSLSAASGRTVTVNYDTSDGTASTLDNDYQPVSSDLTFNPGETSKDVTVIAIRDDSIENDETFFVTLSGPINAALGTSAGTGMIVNDDFPILTRTWDGGGADSDWTTAGNWVGDVKPNPGDNLVFGAGAARLTNNNTFAPGTAFRSISFSAGGYSISGNAVTLGAGGLVNSAGVNAISIPFDMTETQTYSLGVSTALVLGGAINNGGFLLTVDVGASASLTMANTVSGGGGLVKNNSGTLLLSSDNSYGGPTTLNAGILALGSDTAAGTGSLALNGGTVRGDGSARTLGNPLTLGGNLTVGGTVDLAFDGPATLTGSRTWTVTNTGVTTVGGDMNQSVASALTKAGAGVLVLSGSNGFTGGTTLSAGTIDIGNDSALGTGALAVLAGTLRADGGAHTLANAVTLASNVTVGGTNDLTLAGPVTMTGNRTITVANTGQTTISGNIGQSSGSRRLTKAGAGDLVLSGSNTYSGGTTLSAGTLGIGNNSALGGGALTMNAGALRADGSAQSLGNAVTLGGNFTFSGSQNLTLTGAATLTGSRTITVTNTALSTFAGAIGQSGNKRSLTKAGVGTLVLGGNNSYAGGTTINAGTLRVDGTLTSGLITVNAGGTLAGSGTVGAVTVSGGAMSPGASPAILNSGNLALNASAIYLVELNSATAGSGYDQVNVTGTVSLGGSTLNVSLGYSPTVGTSFILINNNGTDAVVGTFSGLAQGATLSISGMIFQISYIGSTGNDVVLTRIS